MNPINDDENDEMMQTLETPKPTMEALSTDTSETEIQMLADPEYIIEVDQITATHDETGNEYTLWRVVGRRADIAMTEKKEVSPHLPEAIMGVCEALERGGEI